MKAFMRGFAVDMLLAIIAGGIFFSYLHVYEIRDISTRLDALEEEQENDRLAIKLLLDYHNEYVWRHGKHPIPDPGPLSDVKYYMGIYVDSSDTMIRIDYDSTTPPREKGE